MLAGTEWENRSQSYRTVLPLASGGVGEVELAVRSEGSFERFYAIKRLRPAFREDPDFRSMFVDEARIAGLIRHPNVVSVLDVGENSSGPYLVMEYVDGVSVSKLISRARERNEHLPLQVACRIALEAAEGLHAAHELKDREGEALHLVHRDVSPQNLLVGFDGITRVTDFGIAKALGRSTHTQTGVVKGKFGYMPPEVLLYRGADRRSDLFSLGIVLFELCAGRRLYRSEKEHDGPRRILEEPPPDLGEERDEVPPRLIQLLFSMLSKEPEQRPETARHVARELEAIIGGLVAEQGRVEVGSCVQRLLGDVQEARRLELRAAEAEATVPSFDVDAARSLLEETAPGQAVSPRRSRARWLFASLLVAAVVSAAVVASLRWQEEGSVAEAPPAEPAEPEAAPDEIEEPRRGSLSAVAGPPGASSSRSAEGVEEPADRAERPAEDDVEEALASGSEGSPAEPVRAPSAAERARARARAARMAKARRAAMRDGMGSGIPLWTDWDSQ